MWFLHDSEGQRIAQVSLSSDEAKARHLAELINLGVKAEPYAALYADLSARLSRVRSYGDGLRGCYRLDGDTVQRVLKKLCLGYNTDGSLPARPDPRTAEEWGTDLAAAPEGEHLDVTTVRPDGSRYVRHAWKCVEDDETGAFFWADPDAGGSSGLSDMEEEDNVKVVAWKLQAKPYQG